MCQEGEHKTQKQLFANMFAIILNKFIIQYEFLFH